MTDASLLAELQTHVYDAPRGLRNDTEMARLLNVASGSITVRDTLIPKTKFLLGITPSILVLPGMSAALQSTWDRALAVVRACDDGVSLSEPSVIALLEKSVADGVLTQAESDAIGSRNGSRAEQLWGAGATVSLGDVSRVLNAS